MKKEREAEEEEEEAEQEENEGLDKAVDNREVNEYGWGWWQAEDPCPASMRSRLRRRGAQARLNCHKPTGDVSATHVWQTNMEKFGI